MPIAEIAVTLAGLAAIAFLAWFFFGPKRAEAAQVKGNVQEIVVTVKGGYSPDIIRVKKGIPLRLIFDRKEAGRGFESLQGRHLEVARIYVNLRGSLRDEHQDV